jgi:long-subunit acyl-CoA synthetase (AMP-forming)
MEVDRAPGLDGATLVEAFQLTAAAFADKPALRVAHSDDAITWAEYARRVERIAGGLAELGVGRGDTVAMLLPNCPQFHLIDVAAMHLGATPFSIYNTLAPEQIAHLFENAQNPVVVTDAPASIASARSPANGTSSRSLAEDGELLVRGDVVMRGYRNSPRRPPRRSTTTAGCTPATSARSTTTAT